MLVSLSKLAVISLSISSGSSSFLEVHSFNSNDFELYLQQIPSWCLLDNDEKKEKREEEN